MSDGHRNRPTQSEQSLLNIYKTLFFVRKSKYIYLFIFEINGVGSVNRISNALMQTWARHSFVLNTYILHILFLIMIIINKIL